MRNILFKECKLSASILSFLFILFGLMFLLPGYPILCSEFFVTLGIFQSFQAARESNDIVYSALLPIAKKDVVKGKYLFVCMIEAASLVLMFAAILVRMTGFGDAVYRQNALMNANLFALGATLMLFGLFNWIFVAGFFKTAYKFARPFVTYIIVVFVMIGVFEALHHIPSLKSLNAFGTEHLGLQLAMLCAGGVLFALMTGIAYHTACKRFETIDL